MWFLSHRLNVLVEFIRAHYAGISEFHLNTDYRKMISVCIILFKFLHNGSSKNGRKTTASAPAVSANFSCNFDFHSWISPDRFQYKASQFLFKISVTCDSKGNTVKFSHFYFTFISKIVT